MQRDSTDVRAEWLALRNQEKGLCALDIAERLGVSECELVASATQRPAEVTATRLESDFGELIRRLPSLGRVKTITRNPNAVIEVEGTYDNIEIFGAMGQSVGTIDLRIFMQRWKSGFSITDETKRGVSRSLQFFDATGRAIHKVYLREESDESAYASIVRDHTSTDQGAFQSVDPPKTIPPLRADDEVDRASLLAAWQAMKDTHEFFGLLRRFGVSRTQAFRLVGTDLAKPLDNGALERLLGHARTTETPFMTFVGNNGVIQIHTGVIRRVATMGEWVNVLDPDFNLHIRGDRIAETWIVRKPTSDGIVTSLELFSADGEQMAHFVGKRKPGSTESPAWRALVESVDSSMPLLS